MRFWITDADNFPIKFRFDSRQRARFSGAASGRTYWVLHFGGLGRHGAGAGVLVGTRSQLEPCYERTNPQFSGRTRGYYG